MFKERGEQRSLAALSPVLLTLHVLAFQIMSIAHLSVEKCFIAHVKGDVPADFFFCCYLFLMQRILCPLFRDPNAPIDRYFFSANQFLIGNQSMFRLLLCSVSPCEHLTADSFLNGFL